MTCVCVDAFSFFYIERKLNGQIYVKLKKEALLIQIFIFDMYKSLDGKIIFIMIISFK